MRLSNKLSAAAGVLSAVIISALAADAVLTVIAGAAGPGQVAWETLATGGSVLWPVVYAAAEAATLVVYTYAAYLTYRLFARGAPEDGEVAGHTGTGGPLSVGRLRGVVLLAVAATAASMLARYYQPLVCGVMGVPEQVFTGIYAAIGTAYIVTSVLALVEGSLQGAFRPGAGRTRVAAAAGVTLAAQLAAGPAWDASLRWLWPWLIEDIPRAAQAASDISWAMTSGAGYAVGFAACLSLCTRPRARHHGQDRPGTAPEPQEDPA